MKTTLNTLKCSDIAVVDTFTDVDTSLKLMEMGCLPGETIVVERFAPLGDPMVISVAGYALCLRKAEAASVVVTKL